MQAPHDMWLYDKEGTPKLFKEGDDIPNGWKDSPDGGKAPKASVEADDDGE